MGASIGGSMHSDSDGAPTSEASNATVPDRWTRNFETRPNIPRCGPRLVRGAVERYGIPAAERRDLNMITAFEWICETRLSVTPRTSPISERVIPSS